MGDTVRRTADKAGFVPGSLVYVGEQIQEQIKITIIDYNEKQYQEKEVKKVDETFPFKNTPSVTWINLDGLHQIESIQRIGEYFGVHPLILEDILNTHQRPKIEEFETYLYIVLKVLNYGKNQKIEDNQVSLIISKDFLFSFFEKETPILNSLRERIKTNKGRIRKCGTDYLAYAIMDVVVDHYFVIIDKIEDTLETMEEKLITHPDSQDMIEMQRLKRTMIELRKVISPLRELVNMIPKLETPLIQKETLLYFRDIYDHTVRIVEAIEIFRDNLSSLIEIYLSSLSNKMNEIMKVLTMFSTIFIPLTYLAGIYGMNFKHFPELQWEWGYPAFWIVNLVVMLLLLSYFRNKKWI